MSNWYFLGAYWDARQETVDQCAERALGFFDSLARCDSRLGQWYHLGRSRKDALRRRVDVTGRESLLALLKHGRARTDVGNAVMEDLGFKIFLWNGAEPGSEAGLDMKCGGYSEYVGNFVTLDLPEKLGDLEDHGRMRAVLETVARAWDPKWAGVSSDTARELRNFDAKRPFVDWMLYVNRQWLPTVPPLEPPAFSAPLDELGTIIVVQDEPPDPRNMAHIIHINNVQAALDRALRKA